MDWLQTSVPTNEYTSLCKAKSKNVWSLDKTPLGVESFELFHVLFVSTLLNLWNGFKFFPRCPKEKLSREVMWQITKILSIRTKLCLTTAINKVNCGLDWGKPVADLWLICFCNFLSFFDNIRLLLENSSLKKCVGSSVCNGISCSAAGYI